MLYHLRRAALRLDAQRAPRNAPRSAAGIPTSVRQAIRGTYLVFFSALAGCSASGGHPAGGPNGAAAGSQLSLFRVDGAQATPGSGAAGVSSIDVAFTALAQRQYFFAQDPTAGGTLTIATSQCTAGKNVVVTVSPQSGPAAGTTFSIISSAAGTCVVTVSSASGAIGTLFVGVTTTGGTVS